MNATAIRTRLYDYIRITDEKNLQAIYTLLEPQMEGQCEWWKDKQLLAEFDDRCRVIESGHDKGFSLNELETSIAKLRQERYGR